MKKLLIPSIFFVLLISFSFAQKPYKVVFYNLENLIPKFWMTSSLLMAPRNGIQPNITKSSTTQSGYFLILQPSIRIIRL